MSDDTAEPRGDADICLPDLAEVIEVVREVIEVVRGRTGVGVVGRALP